MQTMSAPVNASPSSPSRSHSSRRSSGFVRRWLHNREDPDNDPRAAFGGVHDFFHSGTWYVIRNVAILFVVVFWLASGFWVYKDARRRIAGPAGSSGSRRCSASCPFLGPLVYMLFRPPEYLEDVRERELEIRAMEERLSVRDMQCPVCRAEVEASFLVCPVCTTRSSRRARTAARRSRRSGRCARTARHRSSRRGRPARRASAPRRRVVSE